MKNNVYTQDVVEKNCTYEGCAFKNISINVEGVTFIDCNFYNCKCAFKNVSLIKCTGLNSLTPYDWDRVYIDNWLCTWPTQVYNPYFFIGDGFVIYDDEFIENKDCDIYPMIKGLLRKKKKEYTIKKVFKVIASSKEEARRMIHDK